jgi:hypothetical protein
LREKLAEALHAEHCDKWNADASKVAARVEAAATELARYRELVEPIVAILVEVAAANKEVSRVNGCAPKGVHRRLDKINLAWAERLLLPDPADRNHDLWPPPQPSIAVAFVQSMGAYWQGDPRQYSGEWWRVKQEQQEREREQQRRLAEYNEQRSREQTERQNREERERFLASQRRG